MIWLRFGCALAMYVDGSLPLVNAPPRRSRKTLASGMDRYEAPTPQEGNTCEG